MMWDLPVSVEINGRKYDIRNKCDYRVVLDAIVALNDLNLPFENRIQCALFIFYEDLSGCDDIKSAIKEMMKIINNGTEEYEENSNKPRLIDWEHDFKLIAPPVSRVLGYSVRDIGRYTHYYDFIGAYLEIGECVLSNVVSIRNKKAKGKKLDKQEEEFYRENRNMIDFPQNLTAEEKAWLNSDW